MENESLMKTEIYNLIYKLNDGDKFDTHAIIKYFLNGDRNLKNIYMNEYKICKYSDIRDFHANISKIIRDSGLVEDIGDIKSFNVNENLTVNKLWKRNGKGK